MPQDPACLVANKLNKLQRSKQAGLHAPIMTKKIGSLVIILLRWCLCCVVLLFVG